MTIAFDATPERLSLINRTQPNVVCLSLARGEKTAIRQGLLPSPISVGPKSDNWDGAFDSKFVDLALKGDPHVQRVIATAELNLNRHTIETTGELVQEAMRHCRKFDISAPAWLLRKLVEDQEGRFRARAGGQDHKPATGRQRASVERHAALLRPVNLAMAARLFADPDKLIDEAFAEVAKEFGISIFTCRRIHKASVAAGGYELQSLRRYLKAYEKETGSRLLMPP